MEHMTMRWQPHLLDSGDWAIVTHTDEPEEWFVCEICGHLPDDETGERTARAICDAHNAALDTAASPAVDSAPYDESGGSEKPPQ